MEKIDGNGETETSEKDERKEGIIQEGSELGKKVTGGAKEGEMKRAMGEKRWNGQQKGRRPSAA